MNYICYIFGYGSLVNVKNRNKTCSTQGFPAIINKDFKYVRTASYPAMGIKKIKKGDSKKPINGVLLEVTPDQLKKFDKREKHYYRIKVPHEYITSLSKIQIDKTLPVYIYKPKSSFGKKTRKKPSKKYLNIVIDGFKKYGKKFSDMFLSTTIDLPKKINKFTRKMRGGMEESSHPPLSLSQLIRNIEVGKVFTVDGIEGVYRVTELAQEGSIYKINSIKVGSESSPIRLYLTYNLSNGKVTVTEASTIPSSPQVTLGPEDMPNVHTAAEILGNTREARRLVLLTKKERNDPEMFRHPPEIGGTRKHKKSKKKRTRKNQKGGDEQPSLQHVLMLISTGRIFTEYPDENDRNYLINNVVNRWKEVTLESSQNDTVLDRHIKNLKRAILGYTIHILEPPDNAVLMNLNSLEEILMDENTPYRNLPEDEGVHKVKKINMFRNIINMINSLTDRTN